MGPSDRCARHSQAAWARLRASSVRRAQCGRLWGDGAIGAAPAWGAAGSGRDGSNLADFGALAAPGDLSRKSWRQRTDSSSPPWMIWPAWVTIWLLIFDTID